MAAAEDGLQMELFVGTSGFSYKEWKGNFYPEKHPDKELLAYYAKRLSSVEINNTFYRSPRPEMLEKWATLVPEDFVFVLKAPQRITHRAKLVDVEEPVQQLWKASHVLGKHRGPILFQLPPYLRCDLPRLKSFLAGLPEGLDPVLEFRHISWGNDEVLAVLKEHGAALCHADMEGNKMGQEQEPAATSRFGYLRLRRPGYSTVELQAWARRIREQPWERVFVFFKHEDEGAAPRMALAFAEAFAAP